MFGSHTNIPNIQWNISITGPATLQCTISEPLPSKKTGMAIQIVNYNPTVSQKNNKIPRIFSHFS